VLNIVRTKKKETKSPKKILKKQKSAGPANKAEYLAWKIKDKPSQTINNDIVSDSRSY
jgi:hypothetical protein